MFGDRALLQRGVEAKLAHEDEMQQVPCDVEQTVVTLSRCVVVPWGA